MSHRGNHDYEVGYGRPPRHSRFQKGQSGNPKGRPRQRRNLRTVLDEALQATSPATLKRRPLRMKCIDALVRSTVYDALKGDPKAFTNLMIMMRQTGAMGEAAEPAAETDLTAEDKKILERFLQRNGQPSPPVSKPAPPSCEQKPKGGGK